MSRPALAESCARFGIDARVVLDELLARHGVDATTALFSESQGHVLVSVLREEDVRFTYMCEARGFSRLWWAVRTGPFR